MSYIIEIQWHAFRRAVIPIHTPAAQLRDMRRAFFGGAWACYSLVMNHLEPGHDSTDADMKLMTDLDREMREFGPVSNPADPAEVRAFARPAQAVGAGGGNAMERVSGIEPPGLQREPAAQRLECGPYEHCREVWWQCSVCGEKYTDKNPESR